MSDKLLPCEHTVSLGLSCRDYTPLITSIHSCYIALKTAGRAVDLYCLCKGVFTVADICSAAYPRGGKCDTPVRPDVDFCVLNSQEESAVLNGPIRIVAGCVDLTCSCTFREPSVRLRCLLLDKNESLRPAGITATSIIILL